MSDDLTAHPMYLKERIPVALPVALNELAEEIHECAKELGWHQGNGHTFGDYLALMHSELSEALEEYRVGHKYDEVYEIDGKPEGIPIELADTVIRILDFCAMYGIDIEDAVQRKLEYNKTRPWRHGNKLL